MIPDKVWQDVRWRSSHNVDHCDVIPFLNLARAESWAASHHACDNVTLHHQANLEQQSRLASDQYISNPRKGGGIGGIASHLCRCIGNTKRVVALWMARGLSQLIWCRPQEFDLALLSCICFGILQCRSSLWLGGYPPRAPKNEKKAEESGELGQNFHRRCC